MTTPSPSASDRRVIRRWQVASFVFPVVVLCLALGVSWLAREREREVIDRAIQADFDARAREIAGIFKERLNACEQVARATTGLFAASSQVSASEFRTFVAHLNVRRIPGVHGVGFVEVLPHAAAAGGRASRAAYFEPPDRRFSIPGSDYFADPTRHPAMIAARDSGLAAVSDKRKLPGEDADAIEGGYRVYLPVYRNHAPTGSVGERRTALAGWVYAAFSMQGLTSGILGERKDIAIDVYDGSDMSDDVLLFNTPQDRVGGESELKLLGRTVPVEVGGYAWTVSAQALPTVSTSLALDNLRLLARLGVVASLLLAWLMWLAVRWRLRVLRAQEERRQADRQAVLNQERQRLMQDMHDGLGSSLISALRVVEHGQLGEADVAQVLHSCIDDLRLTIDSMEPVEADLLLLLATLRFRLAPRLEATGIALHWEVQDVPALDWLTPRNSLHILRIMQEAFTNIVRHANATDIRVATAVARDAVVVTVSDNGRGFDVDQALQGRGKGLANQQRRSEDIGAEIRWSSSAAGTRLSLRLPLVRR